MIYLIEILIKKVKRTKNRPIAAGKITIKLAFNLYISSLFLSFACFNKF